MLAKVPRLARHCFNSSFKSLQVQLPWQARTNTVLGALLLCRRGNSSNIWGLNKYLMSVLVQRHYNINNSCSKSMSSSVDTSKERETTPNYVISIANWLNTNTRIRDSELSADTYHRISEETMENILEYLENLGDELDNVKDYDVEYSSGVLTLKCGLAGTYVINKQPPNKQIWLSSPLSGPKRYDYDLATQKWFYHRDNTTLYDLLNEELSKIFNRNVKPKFIFRFKNSPTQRSIVAAQASRSSTIPQSSPHIFGQPTSVALLSSLGIGSTGAKLSSKCDLRQTYHGSGNSLLIRYDRLVRELWVELRQAEEKHFSLEMGNAEQEQELLDKIESLNTAMYGKIPYIFSYAAAQNLFRFYAITGKESRIPISECVICQHPWRNSWQA
ncbi:5432_t:CDS:2 [Ambispora gerdemannii]|uniref:ferroxidase n=1 Tax=Ambispora gerdemannii TaxID=144530 RepID=A0A9N9A031_9GLOM|nr:5432_t:CDS:2 [Ambispora gerdemannii]